jgi:hypothetical protein
MTNILTIINTYNLCVLFLVADFIIIFSDFRPVFKSTQNYQFPIVGIDCIGIHIQKVYMSSFTSLGQQIASFHFLHTDLVRDQALELNFLHYEANECVTIK